MEINKTWGPDAWVPVRDGERYCSPACGHRCTWAQFEEATASAQALVERLGAGWVVDVWENLGWHAAARKGPTDAGIGWLATVHADIHVSRRGGPPVFTAYVNTSPQFIESAADPVEAFMGAIGKARAHFQAMAEALDILTPPPVNVLDIPGIERAIEALDEKRPPDPVVVVVRHELAGPTRGFYWRRSIVGQRPGPWRGPYRTEGKAQAIARRYFAEGGNTEPLEFISVNSPDSDYLTDDEAHALKRASQ